MTQYTNILSALEGAGGASREVDAALLNAFHQGMNAAREVVATWMINHSYATGHGDTIADMLDELDWQAQERGQKPRPTNSEVK